MKIEIEVSPKDIRNILLDVKNKNNELNSSNFLENFIEQVQEALLIQQDEIELMDQMIYEKGEH